ncbi:MAG: hypothetical protein IPK84_05125 [Candidatus Moraniibacteriota bacterium]|nr:MAG: hypothetical protein IPK84_05125 [Candidatus Moranbacteria bacterium]
MRVQLPPSAPELAKDVHSQYRNTTSSEVLPVNFQEALKQARDTMCIPQRGDSCLGYGGILCDNTCPAYHAGLARRKAVYEDYEQRRIGERQLPSGVTVRISRNPTAGFTVETGEYINDGNNLPVFTSFTREVFSEEIFQAIRLFCQQ